MKESIALIPPGGDILISRTATAFGLAGTSVIILAVIYSALRYCGRQGERYSPLNHFISELGEVGVSQAAWAFNMGLTAGGMLLVPFMVGMGMAFQSLWGWLGTAAGVVAALGAATVGLYPMNNLEAHGRAAMTYFRAGLVMVIFYALAIFTQRTPVLPPAANLLSLAAGLSYSSFLLLLRRPRPRKAERPAEEDPLNPLAVIPDRPRVWLLPLVEWLVFASTVLWIFGVAALG